MSHLNKQLDMDLSKFMDLSQPIDAEAVPPTCGSDRVINPPTVRLVQGKVSMRFHDTNAAERAAKHLGQNGHPLGEDIRRAAVIARSLRLNQMTLDFTK